MRTTGVRSYAVASAVCFGLLSLPAIAFGQPEPVDFSGTASAVFVNPRPSNADVSGVGTNSFSWGDTLASNLSFGGGGFTSGFKDVFSLGTISYSNGVTHTGEAGGVDLQITISLTTPHATAQTFTRSISIINTPNDEDDPEGSADIAFLPATFPTVTFELDGQNYTLNIIGFGTVTGNGFTTAINKFHVGEGGSASAHLLGSITQACVSLPETPPVREQIQGFPNCSPSKIGTLEPMWGRFGFRDVLESDAGDKLELKCDSIFGIGAAYQMFYTPKDGSPLRVGLCPWDGGCNTAEFYHSGDKNNNGKPDCFIRTLWNSADYHDNDIPNPWTLSLDTDDTYLDWAVSIYDANSGFLEKKDYKFEYALGPPVPFANCGNPGAPIPEGALIATLSADPPLGPETEAYFDQVLEMMAKVTVSGEPMGELLAPRCDLDGDGICFDFEDQLIMQFAQGKCEGNPEYRVFADLDKNGCIDAVDRQHYLSDEDKDGVRDLLDNCPAVFNKDQTDSNGNGVGDACDRQVGVVGDLDNDGDVDRNDINLLLTRRNQPATGPDDPADLDHDGRITVRDGRRLTQLCTRRGCAIR